MSSSEESSSEDASSPAADPSAAADVLDRVKAAVEEGDYARARRLSHDIPREELSEDEAERLEALMEATGADPAGVYIAIAGFLLLVIIAALLYL